MLKKYRINGKEWQFEEGTQPAGAVEIVNKAPVKAAEPVKTPEPVKKAAEKPANKAKMPVNKAKGTKKK